MTNRLASRVRAIRFSTLDFKVGARMLARYPGLTFAGTAAIAVAIALGTLYFEAVNKWKNPRLPVRDASCSGLRRRTTRPISRYARATAG